MSFYAGTTSTNGGNNTGWVFTAPPVGLWYAGANSIDGGNNTGWLMSNSPTVSYNLITTSLSASSAVVAKAQLTQSVNTLISSASIITSNANSIIRISNSFSSVGILNVNDLLLAALFAQSGAVSTCIGDIYSKLELQSDSYVNSTGFGDIYSIMSLAGDAEVITDMKRGVLSPTVMYPLNGINRSYPLYGINRSYP